MSRDSRQSDTITPPRTQCPTCGFWREDPAGAARCIRPECVFEGHAAVGDRVCFYRGCNSPLADDGPEGHPDGLCEVHRLALADGDPKATRAVEAFRELITAIPPRRAARGSRAPQQCTAAGCTHTRWSRGLCSTHYKAMRKRERQRAAVKSAIRNGKSAIQ